MEASREGYEKKEKRVPRKMGTVGSLRAWRLGEIKSRIGLFSCNACQEGTQQPSVLFVLDGGASIQLNIGRDSLNYRLVDPGRAL